VSGLLLILLLHLCSFTDFQKHDAASFDQLLAVNICKLREFIASSPKLSVFADRLGFNAEEMSEYDVCWRFVECNIQLLQLLCKNLSAITENHETLPHNTCGCAETNPETSAPELSSDTLSLAQSKAVSSSLQFVTGLGICPLLVPGVGIPLSRRSELACRLVTNAAASRLSDCDKYYRLAVCIEILLSCLEQTALASIVLSANLCDLLASLMQVCYAPDWKKYAAEVEMAKPGQKDLGFICRHRNYKDELMKLVDQVPSSTLVRELLILQSGCPPSPNMKVCTFCVVFNAFLLPSAASCFHSRIFLNS